jgi:hypothetical protein
MFEHVHHFQQLSSCVGSNSCGALFNTAPSDTAGLWFGATHLQATNFSGAAINHSLYFADKAWLGDDYMGSHVFHNDTGATPADTNNWPAPTANHLDIYMIGSNQGMYSTFSSINAFWKDTTTMDNLRGADITASSVAGSTETIASNTKPNNVRGGHSVHSNTDETYYNYAGTAI